MNRRSFLKFCGIAPVVPALAVETLKRSKEVCSNCSKFDVCVDHNPNGWCYPYFEQIDFEYLDSLAKHNGVYSFYIKAQGQEKWERIVANNIKTELHKRGGTAYIWNADPTIRIDL